MTVDAAVGVTYDRIASRERDVTRAFLPGTVAENGDVSTSGGGARTVSDPLSVALPQNAYVMTVDANGQRSFTQDGSFHILDGRLLDAAGNAVQGYARPQASLGPLRASELDAKLDRVNDIRLESDGRLTYVRTVIDPRSEEPVQQRVTAGRIALARFPAGSSLQAVDGIHVVAQRDIVPHVGVPGDGGFGLLATQRLAKSHVDVDASLMKLQESYLAFDALRVAKQVHASTQKTAIDVIK